MYVIFLAALLGLLYSLQLLIYRKKWFTGLKVSAFFSTEEVYEGEEAELTETIENAKWLPLPVVKMKLQLSRKLLFRDADNSSVSDYFNRTDIYTIGAYNKVTRTMKFSCPARGYYDFNGVDVVSSDIFSSKIFLQSVDSTSYLYVYPRPYPCELPEALLNKINGDSRAKRNRIEDPFELRGIREYQDFDGMKNINWKASAKTDDFMVNVHGYTTKRTMRIFINMESNALLRRDELNELCISMAVKIAEVSAAEEVPVSVYCNGKDVLNDSPVIIGEGSGASLIRSLNRALARIDMNKGTTDFKELYESVSEEERRDSFDIILSPCMQPLFQDFLAELSKKETEFYWVCLAKSDSPFAVSEEIKDRTIVIDAGEVLNDISRAW
ncbi:MAG: DUF58 domain-containing protein [Lachnospiraceae bacterium]|nr:DUF58 domain-containing protein [Lachnospiraceae bacterium]